MAEDVKKFLTKLYPDADMSRGIDFDRSGAIEANEEVSDFNGDGAIDDIDYAILTFVNRDHFIDKHGAKNWREFERLWDMAAKTTNPIFRKDPPAISTNRRRREEAIQRTVVNERFDGRANRLNQAQAKEVVEIQKAMEELSRRYPSMPLDNIKPSEAKKILASMREIENFNPALAASIEKFTYSVDGYHNGDEKWIHRLLLGGYASGRNVHMNQFIDSKSTAVHEATHVYHHTVEDEDQKELLGAEWNLTNHINMSHRVSEYDLDDGSSIIYLPHLASIDGDYRDIVEDNLAKRKRGEAYDKKLVGLYEKWNSVREGNFNYRWNHVNQAYTPDSEFEEVEAAGKKLDAAKRHFEEVAVEAFGESGKDPFWFDTFYKGGDRKRPIIKGSIMKQTSRCKDVATKERVEAAMRDIND
ncbi:MAG: hypothetical protein HN337_00570, partial [Deltaproteobacteria bacterium]|nr:hypothetical protein [Deltaproteobacteria bacterium]